MKVSHLLRLLAFVGLLTGTTAFNTFAQGTGPGPHLTILSPTNGQVFSPPANITILAGVVDANSFVHVISFYSGTNLLGTLILDPIVTELNGETNTISFTWQNVPQGNYTLRVVGTDLQGLSGTSAPVNISVGPSNAPPVVTIYATDPIAVAGTNYPCPPPPAAFANYCSGTNTATFLVRRTGSDGSGLTVYYAIGGTASNGVDYVALPGYVAIPAGQDYGLITIIPLENTNISATPIKTVILTLTEPPGSTPPTNAPPPYIIGWPGKAEAVIIEDRCMPGPVTGILPDQSFHLCMSGTNGEAYCVRISTNLANWAPVCTNVVLKGSIQFTDPETGSYNSRYYLVSPATATPVY